MVSQDLRSFGRRFGARGALALAAAALAALAASAGAMKAVRARQAEVESPAPARPAPSGVGALGRLEPGWKVYQVGPATSADGARVEALNVEEGEEVAAGAVLAVLDTATRRRAALREAGAQVRGASARLALVRAGAKAEEVAAQLAAAEQLRASLQKAELDLKRAEPLHSRAAMSAEEYDLRRSQVRTSLAALRQAEATVAALRAVRPEDVAVAEAELAKAEAGVARAEAELEATNVRAPIAGRVLKLHARAGERVGESGLAELGDTARMHAVAEVYERDAPRVRAGQRAAVRVQSLPGELAGEVAHVGWKVGRQVVFDNDPVKDTDARVVEVRVKLDPADSARVSGLSYARVEVRIDAPPGGGR